jgi:hypothetical protein
MSYQDKATEQERQLLALFNAKLPAIQAYKTSRGVDYETAFQAVTGTPWPANRSVKLTKGKGEITADRTVKSVLGRYVAPIAAGAATALTLGGAAPTFGLLGGGAGATGASAAGAGATGAGITAAGAGAAGAGAAPSLFNLSNILQAGIGPGIYGVSSYFGNRAAADANDRATQAQIESANRAADIQAKAAADNLAFLREQEAQRKAEFDRVQALNKEQYDLQQGRLTPYRTLGDLGVRRLTLGLQPGSGAAFLPPSTRTLG